MCIFAKWEIDFHINKMRTPIQMFRPIAELHNILRDAKIDITIDQLRSGFSFGAHPDPTIGGSSILNPTDFGDVIATIPPAALEAGRAEKLKLTQLESGAFSEDEVKGSFPELFAGA